MTAIAELPASKPAAVEQEPRRVSLFGVEIDVVTMRQAVAVVRELLETTASSCGFVVTPNVDHIVMLQEREDLVACYHDASLVLADGWPIVAASRLLGSALPERVAGSDLVPSLFAAAKPADELTTYLLGAAPGVAETAAEQIEKRWPAVRVVGTYSPPMGFEHDAAENQAILARIAKAAPKLLVVGLGAPKQELWVHQHHAQIEARVALCVGATIDFLAGNRKRAPLWMQRLGLEWLHRLLSEPRRMAGRYGRDAIVFPRVVARQWLRGSGR